VRIAAAIERVGAFEQPPPRALDKIYPLPSPSFCHAMIQRMLKAAVLRGDRGRHEQPTAAPCATVGPRGKAGVWRKAQVYERTLPSKDDEPRTSWGLW
jgi:hypothetical protein